MRLLATWLVHALVFVLGFVVERWSAGVLPRRAAIACICLLTVAAVVTGLAWRGL